MIEVQKKACRILSDVNFSNERTHLRSRKRRSFVVFPQKCNRRLDKQNKAVQGNVAGVMQPEPISEKKNSEKFLQRCSAATVRTKEFPTHAHSALGTLSGRSWSALGRSRALWDALETLLGRS